MDAVLRPNQQTASLADIARSWARERGHSVSEGFEELLAAYWRGEFEEPGMHEPKLGQPVIERREIVVEQFSVPGLSGEDPIDARYFDADGLYAARPKLEFRCGQRSEVFARLELSGPFNLDAGGDPAGIYDQLARCRLQDWGAFDRMQLSHIHVSRRTYAR
jgi:hypothetical protein